MCVQGQETSTPQAWSLSGKGGRLKDLIHCRSVFSSLISTSGRRNKRRGKVEAGRGTGKREGSSVISWDGELAHIEDGQCIQCYVPCTSESYSLPITALATMKLCLCGLHRLLTIRSLAHADRIDIIHTHTPVPAHIHTIAQTYRS